MKYCILFLVAIIYSCSQPVAKPREQELPELATFKGLVRFEKGFCNFKDCATGALYLLADSTMTIARLYRNATEMAPCPEETVYAVLEGRLFKGSDPRSDPGTLAVVKVDTMTTKNMLNCCIPYDFWCSGTEPFWSLQISKEEKVLYLKDIGTETCKTFDWAPPVTTGNSMTWTVKNRMNPNETMKVSVVQEACSDGMSDMRYDYSCTVIIGKQQLDGCAVKWGKVPAENGEGYR